MKIFFVVITIMVITFVVRKKKKGKSKNLFEITEEGKLEDFEHFFVIIKSERYAIVEGMYKEKGQPNVFSRKRKKIPISELKK